MKNPSNSAPLYLSAREAAGELSVTPATLYAYVSRGLIRSESDGVSRSKRYRAEDVRALQGRRGGSEPRTEREASTVETAVSTITAAGPLYRGVHAVALAGTGSLEQAATLLWGVAEADPFDPANMPVVDERIGAAMEATRTADPIARAIVALALSNEADPRAYNRSREGRHLLGVRVMRLTTGAILGRAPSAGPLHRQLAQAWSGGGTEAADLYRRALVLLADHELNASTWTVRCAASTGLTLYDATVAGLAALKGPRHGGAGPLAAHMVAELAGGDIAARIRRKVALGEPIPGFGHTVYADGDPRAEALLTALRKSGADDALAVQAPALVTEATGLKPNIDFALAVMMRHLGQPIGHETALFAIARTAGWIAHAIEQLETGVLIRPRGRYVGREAGRMAATGM